MTTRCAAQIPGDVQPVTRTAPGTELVDLNVRNIQRIEAGEITILIFTAKRLRDSIKCSWDELLGSQRGDARLQPLLAAVLM